jgi:hypothetical protein
MSRDWLAAYCGILGKPKYRRLTIPARAGLFHVWLLAGGQTPEATWPNRDELADALDLDGYPLDVLDELITRSWLDVDATGRIVVHDWDDWQLAASRAVRREYEADRKREWRRRNRVEQDDVPPLSPAPLSPDSDRTGTQQDKTEQVSPIVRDTSGTRTGRAPYKRPDEPSRGRTNGRARGSLTRVGTIAGGMVPTSGPCRICGGDLTDKEPCKVGPGWIEHAEHPKEWAS